MRRRWLVLAAAVPVALGWAVAMAYPAAAGLAAPAVQVVSSGNWAGYAASGGKGTFTSASASWTQPAGTCTGGSRYAAFWVGLDGYTSGTVEQIGTEVDCAGRTPSYYAWYEIYPGAAVNFPDPVRPGDKFSGSVTARAGGRFQLLLEDVTKGWTQTASATLSGAALSSAEVIAEAPSSGGRTLPLTNFGTVGFTAAAANGTPMAAFSPVEITMPDLAVSAMSGGGSFGVTYTGSVSRGAPGSDRSERRTGSKGLDGAGPSRAAVSSAGRAGARPGWGYGRRSRSA
jgi:hypothetical protein